MEHRRWKQMFNSCPFCSNNLFLVGPSGGLASNFKCLLCGATFNDMGPFGVDLLSEPDRPIDLLTA